MANLFEKPIAAKPMSEFVALPLQFMQGVIDKKQKRYDMAKAQLEQNEDLLFKTKALQGDSARHQEILKGYEDGFTHLVDSVGGDYSKIGAALDLMKNKMRKDLQYGELGAINDAYSAGVLNNKKLTELYQAGKIQKAGYDKGVSAIASHVTTIRNDGTFTKLNTYMPSNITDPYSVIGKSIDTITEKMNPDGTKYMNAGLISSHVQSYLSTQPDVLKSLSEVYSQHPRIKEDGTKQSFEEFYTNTITQLIADKEVKEYAKAGTENSGSLKARVFEGFQNPASTGNLEYSGGSAALGREAWKSISGADTTEAFRKSTSTPEVKRAIAYMQKTSNTPYPKTFRAQKAWLEENSNKPSTQRLITRGITKHEAQTYIDAQGNLLSAAPIKSRNGTPVNAQTQTRLTTPTNKVKPIFLGVAEESDGYAYGSLIFRGTDGKEYIQEPTDLETLASPKYGLNILKRGKFSPTGQRRVKTENSVQYRGPEGKMGVIPPGEYTSEKDFTTGKILLYQDGVVKYAIQEKMTPAGRIDIIQDFTNKK